MLPEIKIIAKGGTMQKNLLKSLSILLVLINSRLRT